MKSVGKSYAKDLSLRYNGMQKKKEKIMGAKFNKFKENLKKTMKNISAVGGNVLEKVNKADKEMEEKIRKIESSV